MNHYLPTEMKIVLRQTRSIIILAVIVQILGGCILNATDGGSSPTGTQDSPPSTMAPSTATGSHRTLTSDDTATAERGTRTPVAISSLTVPLPESTPADTVTVVRHKASPSPAATGVASEAVTADEADTSREQVVASPTITPIFELFDKRTAEVPEICNADTVLSLFETFVRRYNAEDLDGVLALMQDESPGWQPGPHNEEDWMPFEAVSMDHSGDEGFTAWTHSELRFQLAKRFAVDERLRLKRVTVSSTWDRTISPQDSVASKRNVDVGVEFERWSTERDVHTADGKGAVDCKARRITLLVFGG